jgi:hypothetical protein
VDLSNLKSQISEAAREGQSLRTKIHACRGDARHVLWNEKRALGRRTRCLLLTYGYLRDVPYHRIEPRCHRDNHAQWYRLADVLIALEDSRPERIPCEPEPMTFWTRLKTLLPATRAVVPTDDTSPYARYQRREAFRARLETWLRGVEVVPEAPMTEGRP